MGFSSHVKFGMFQSFSPHTVYPCFLKWTEKTNDFSPIGPSFMSTLDLFIPLVDAVIWHMVNFLVQIHLLSGAI